MNAAAPASSGLLEMIGSLALVLGVIIVIAWLVRRMQAGATMRGAALRVVAGIQLGGRERVVLVQAGDTRFLLGVAAGSVNLLHRFVPEDRLSDGSVAAEELVPDGTSARFESTPFAQRLRRAIAQGLGT